MATSSPFGDVDDSVKSVSSPHGSHQHGGAVSLPAGPFELDMQVQADQQDVTRTSPSPDNVWAVRPTSVLTHWFPLLLLVCIAGAGPVATSTIP